MVSKPLGRRLTLGSLLEPTGVHLSDSELETLTRLHNQIVKDLPRLKSGTTKLFKYSVGRETIATILGRHNGDKLDAVQRLPLRDHVMLILATQDKDLGLELLLRRIQKRWPHYSDSSELSPTLQTCMARLRVEEPYWLGFDKPKGQQWRYWYVSDSNDSLKTPREILALRKNYTLRLVHEIHRDVYTSAKSEKAYKEGARVLTRVLRHNTGRVLIERNEDRKKVRALKNVIRRDAKTFDAEKRRIYVRGREAIMSLVCV